MRLVIDAQTLANQRWFPIFDILLLHLEEQRHTFSADDVPAILASGWMQNKSPRDRDLITYSVTARSHDRLADKTIVKIDAVAPRGGRVDDAYTTSLHPQDCLVFLAQPFCVIVENEWFDGAFLLWMARIVGREKFITAYRSSRFVFRHAGGKGSLERSATVLSQGVWPTPNSRHTKAFKLWACAILDNDAKFPGHNPNREIVQSLTPWVAFVHELKRRSIENYIPHTALARYDRSSQFKEKVDALFRLSSDQRRHYHMKAGFRFGDEPIPKKEEYIAASSVTVQEKMLFGSVLDDDWPRLVGGFGGKLSTIYTDDQFRPSAADKAAVNQEDRQEFERLFDVIYERI